MKTSEELKTLVRNKYSTIVQQATSTSSCCGGACGSDPAAPYSIFSDDYSQLPGYQPDADLNLGCGLPTEHAHIAPGHTVVDLGSGAGNDCFVARALAGEQGRVIGLDMTPAMVEKARQNAAKLGYQNVEFHLGDIEQMPLPDALADVVVSNCVLNLVPNKAQAFAETFRILKAGGHFSISDVVISGTLPEGMQAQAELYAGCVSGAVPLAEYLQIVEQSGFENLIVQKKKRVELPPSLLRQYLNEQELAAFFASETGVFSITLYAQKPSAS